MTKKAAPAPLPAAEALPASALDHPTLHALVNARVGGKSQKALAEKFGLPLDYVRAVLHRYLAE